MALCLGPVRLESAKACQVNRQPIDSRQIYIDQPNIDFVYGLEGVCSSKWITDIQFLVFDIIRKPITNEVLSTCMNAITKAVISQLHSIFW